MCICILYIYKIESRYKMKCVKINDATNGRFSRVDQIQYANTTCIRIYTAEVFII